MKPSRPAVFALLSLGVVLWGLCAFRLLEGAAGIDFLQYWAGSKLILHGHDPYSPEAQLLLQQKAWEGVQAELPILMWNPPQVLTLMLPFSALPFHTAYFAWFLLSLIIIVCCSYASILLFPPAVSNERRFVKYSRLLFLLTFPPFAFSLYYGQASPWLLLGFTAALAAFARSKPFWSGLFLSLTLIKPHLLYLYYLYFFWTEWRRKSIKGLAGFLLGAALLSVVPLLLQPEIFQRYLNAMAAPPIIWQTPTLGSWLQAFSGIHHAAIRLLPSLVTALLFFAALRRGRFSEALPQQLLIIVPLSLLTSPYGWAFDQILLLPPAMLAFSAVSGVDRAVRTWLLVLMLLANAANFFIPSTVGQHFFIWYPALLLFVWLRLGETSTAAENSAAYAR